MKKLIFVFFTILISLFTYSQSLLQQNTVARVDYLGFSNGNHVFKISNLQSCAATIQYYFLSATGKKTNITVPANGSTSVSVAGAQLTTETIKAKTTSFCTGVASDPSWVEVVSTGVALPIKFGKISVFRISNQLIKLEFESEEDNSIKHYNILVSEDGKTYRKVDVVFPNGIIGNKRYSVLVKI